MNKVLTGMVAALLLCSCGSDDYEARRDRLAGSLKGSPIGTSPDVWLTKNTDDHVALIFGYMNDFEVCHELAQMYMKKYPGDFYHCTMAN